MQREDVPFCRTSFQINFFCRWKHIAVDLEFFVLPTLEKIQPNFAYWCLVRDPWPWWNYILQKRKQPLFSKNALKIFPIQVYKFSFLITSNIYRFNSNWYWPCWKPLRARVGDCCLKSFKEKQTILYLQQLPKKLYSWLKLYCIITVIFSKRLSRLTGRR